jgi:TolB protein
LLATAGADGTARIWDAGTGQPRLTGGGPPGAIGIVAWSPDSRLLATARLDGLLQVWDAARGAERLSLRVPSASVLAVAWSADGRYLFAASADGVARRYALRLDDLLALAQSRLTRTLTPAEWEQFGLAPTPTPFPVALLPTLTVPPPSATPAPPAAPTPTVPPPPAPSPAPPGGRIAFASNRGDPLQSHIYVMQADGTGQRALTTAPRYNLYPDWSPDGKQIVYVGADPRTATGSPGGDLYLMQADGSGQQRLTHDLNAKWPRWAPDGSAILYADAPENTAAAYDLYLLTPADGAIRRLTDTPGFDGMGAWLPDGQIVFTSARSDGKTTHLYRMHADGTDVQPLVLAPGWQDSPAVAPGGARIAFVSTQDGAERIYTAAADGSDVRQVTTGPGVDRYPTWSPGGGWIAFHSNRDARSNFEIYRVPASGGPVERLTTDPAFDDEPVWHP